MTAVTFAEYTHLRPLGWRNWLIKAMTLTPGTHIQVFIDDQAYVIYLDAEPKIVKRDVWERKMGPYTRSVTIEVDEIPWTQLFNLSRSETTSTGYFLLWWVLLRWLRFPMPWSCTRFAGEVAKLVGIEVTPSAVPTKLMERLDEAVCSSGRGTGR